MLPLSKKKSLKLGFNDLIGAFKLLGYGIDKDEARFDTRHTLDDEKFPVMIVQRAYIAEESSDDDDDEVELEFDDRAKISTIKEMPTNAENGNNKNNSKDSTPDEEDDEDELDIDDI